MSSQSIAIQNIKNNQLANSTIPNEYTPVSMFNFMATFLNAVTQYIQDFSTQIDITLTPTGGFANEHFSTASADVRVMKREVDVVKSTAGALVGFSFGVSSFGFEINVFAKTFLLPNAFFELQLLAPYWFYNNPSLTSKFRVRCMRSTVSNFATRTLLNQEYPLTLTPNGGNQGADRILIFRDGMIKPPGVYYYRVYITPENNFVGDLYSNDNVVQHETSYNIANTSL